MYKIADVAQLAEQLICNQQVIRSNRIIGSRIRDNKIVSRESYLVKKQIIKDIKCISKTYFYNEIRDTNDDIRE